MNFEFFLAKRFLAGQRFGVFRMVTTAIAIGGTALGVAALLITLAVFDGFRTDIQEKILGTHPHLIVSSPFESLIPSDVTMPGKLAGTPHVLAAAPFISAQALLQSPERVTGILLRGIDPKLEDKVTHADTIIVQGRWNALNDHSVILGNELAGAMRAHVGENVTLIAPQQNMSSWTQTPRMRVFEVAGVFKSGMYEYDANMIYTTIAGAQNLLGIQDKISGYGLRVDDINDVSKIGKQVEDHAGPGFWTRSWEDFNKPLFSAMALERKMMFLILSLIILVASFMIVSNLLLLTIEKAREIGILQAIGAKPSQIRNIFLINGLMLGGSGVGIGLALGILISVLLEKFRLIPLPSDVYYIDRLPAHLSVSMVVSVAVCAFILVLASILYPARKAQQMDPVQAIRHG
jgi:lipoprotein-releasing system permease protein